LPDHILFATVTAAVEEDLNEANAAAAAVEAEVAAPNEQNELEGTQAWVPDCTGIDTGNNLAGPACKSYATCVGGTIAGVPVECTAGTLYNKVLGVCDYEANVICYTSGGGGGGEEEEEGKGNTEAETTAVEGVLGGTGGGAGVVSSSSEGKEEEGVEEEEEEIGDTPSPAAAATTTTPPPRTSSNPVTADPFEPTAMPDLLLPTPPPETRSPSANVPLEDALDHAKHDINTKILVSARTNSTGGREWSPSTVYRYDGLLRGLRLMYLEGVGELRFYVGDDDDDDYGGASSSSSPSDNNDGGRRAVGRGVVDGTVVGLVNIAAFLAQSMKETIMYDSCDENNWDVIDGRYPISNSCGQLNQEYQEYACPEGTEHMQCDVDVDMEQVAYTNAKWYGAPGPLYCGPKS
jgi:hypothetical protein